MSYELEKRFDFYHRLFIKHLEKRNNVSLLSIVTPSRFEITTGFDYDNWNGGQYGHKITIFVEQDSFLDILDLKQEYEEKINAEFNKIFTTSNEYISAVEIIPSDDFDINTENGFPIYTHNKIPSVNDDDLVRIWKNKNALKIFISHRDADKVEASSIQRELDKFSISSFVAHENIEGTEEWIKEIFIALQSMDIFLAYITNDFFDSIWTNQEIGFALGRNIPIIPIKNKRNPKGFLSILQAKKYNKDDFCFDFVSLLLKPSGISTKTKNKLIDCLISRFSISKSFIESEKIFRYFDNVSSLSPDQTKNIIDAFNSNSQICGCFYLNGQGKYEKTDNGLLCERLKQWTGKDYEISSDEDLGVIIREQGTKPISTSSKEIPF